MIIDQWGFYDPGYFPEDEMTLDVMTLHKSFVRNDPKMTLFSRKKDEMNYLSLFYLFLN